MKLTHAESRLYKKIKKANGLFDSEIDRSVFPKFVMNKLIKNNLVRVNLLGRYVPADTAHATPEVSEWTNARCEYDEFNKWMSNEHDITNTKA